MITQKGGCEMLPSFFNLNDMYKYLKDHNGKKAGDIVADVNPYLERLKVVKKIEPITQVKEPKKSKK